MCPRIAVSSSFPRTCFAFAIGLREARPEPATAGRRLCGSGVATRDPCRLAPGATPAHRSHPPGSCSPMLGTLALALLAAFAPADEPARDTTAVLALFRSRPDEPLVSYRTLRLMKTTSGRFGLEAWMNVLVELDAERGFRYRVLDEGGSSMLRNKVFRKMLESEAEALAAGSVTRAAISDENYEFTPDGHAGDGSHRLRARPRRPDPLLFDGVFIVSAAGDLQRLEGRLAKAPSWWTPRVEVVRDFGRVGGQRVPLRMESIAHTRLLGRATLTVVYEHELVNGVAAAASARP